MGDGDLSDPEQERLAHVIIENQLRAGILGSGGNRVLSEGTYSVSVNSDNTTNVILVGSPAVQGFANEGLVEVYGSVTWDNIGPGALNYLYIRAGANTYVDPEDITPVTSLSPIVQNDHLLLVTIDTSGATPASVPVVDTNPEGKATAFNLFELLNNNIDPFGAALTQSILTILQQFSVRLGKDKTTLFQQLNPDATLPLISLENAGSQPEISSSRELRLADSRSPNGIALTDTANAAFQGIAISLIGALNEILAGLQTHIEADDDPHGETLTQTRMILRESLSLSRLILTTPSPPPPPPGGTTTTTNPLAPPPPPPFSQIYSNGELVFEDIRAEIALSEEGHPEYLGNNQSIIGALNELLGILGVLNGQVNGLFGNQIPAQSPITFEIYPDDIGYSLHFKLTFVESDSFTTPPSG